MNNRLESCNILSLKCNSPGCTCSFLYRVEMDVQGNESNVEAFVQPIIYKHHPANGATIHLLEN